MAREFNLPDLGEGIDSGDVAQVHVSEGDTIEAEQTVLEIETEKAVLEVPCPFGGKVTQVHVKQGDKVEVGAPLISVEGEGEEEAEEAGEGKEKTAGEKKKPTEKKEGKEEEAKKGEKKKKKKEPEPAEEAEEEPDEEAPRAEEESEEEVSEEAEEETEPEEEPAREKKPAASRPQRKPPAEPAKEGRKESDAAIPAGPATRRLARELGVDIEALAEAYPDERLTEQHVKDFVKSGKTRAAEPAAPEKEEEEQKEEKAPPAEARAKVTTTAELPDFSQWGEIEVVQFSSMQRKTADHVHHSWVTAPHVTQFDEADIGALEALRKRYRQRDETKEIRLTVTAFVLKASAIALKGFPDFNSSLDTENGQLIRKKYYHIGLAVDTEAGLIVPVIRDVDRKRVLKLAQEMNAIAERTRQRKIELAELRGGTFTVTNLGGIGGTAFTPIINYPEVAILGVSRGKEVPIIADGQLRSKLMLPLSLSYDHRVVNGADGARFLRKVCELLEDPELLLLEG